MNNKIYLVGMLSALLSACGGGSSGSGGTAGLYSPDEGLVGTWIQTNDNIVVATGETFKLRRQTIVVTKVGEDLQFTDCITGDSLLAPESDSVIDFYQADVPSLEVVDQSTMTTTVDLGSAKTDVVLKKVSDDTTVLLAQANFTSPAPISDWDQICVESILIGSNTEVKLKALDQDNAVSVDVDFVFSSEVAAGQYTYPSADNNVSGNFDSPLLTATVYNPQGTIVVSDSATKDFSVDLLLENSIDSNLVSFDGIIKFEPFWFSYE